MSDYWTGVAWGVAYLVGTIIALLIAVAKERRQ